MMSNFKKLVRSSCEIEQVKASVFFLGEACLIGIGLILDQAAKQMEELGMADSIEVIRSFCRGMVEYSPEVIFTEGTEMVLKEFFEFVARAGIDLPDQLNGLSDRITNLTAQIELSCEVE